MRARFFSLAFVAAIVGIGAACNSITGVDSLTFDESTGGTGGSTGGTSTSTGASGGTSSTNCKSPSKLTKIPPNSECETCLKASCCPEMTLCNVSPKCAACVDNDNCTDMVPEEAQNLYNCAKNHCPLSCGLSQVTMGGGGTGNGGASSGGDAACAMEPTTLSMCDQCCQTNHPEGSSMYTGAIIACGCDPTGMCTAACPNLCTSMDKPSADCITCLQGCFSGPAGASCIMHQDCVAFANCVGACPSG